MISYDSKAARDTERSYLTPEIVRQRLKTLDAMVLRPGQRVLDAGCGTGLLAEQIAKSVGNSGHVACIDCSADMLELARNRCRDLNQVELLQEYVEQLDFEADSFDAVSCIQTLLYVKQVETALKQMHRVLKPRGRIAILETDWRGLVLANQDESMTRKIADAWDSAVESPNLPARLGALLRRAGFSAIKVEAIPIVNTSYSGNNFSSGMLKWFAKNAVKHDAISAQESKQWQAQIQELADKDSYFFCVNRFLFSAVK